MEQEHKSRVNFVVRLESETADHLSELAAATGRTKAQAVRAAIEVVYALWIRKTSPNDLATQIPTDSKISG